MIEKLTAIEVVKKLRTAIPRISLIEQIKLRLLLSDWAVEELNRQMAEALKPVEMMAVPGLYRKYIVRKADGSSIDMSAEYFVLRLDGGGCDKVHIEACRKAAEAYAAAVEGTHLSEVGVELRALLAALKGGES